MKTRKEMNILALNYLYKAQFREVTPQCGPGSRKIPDADTMRATRLDMCIARERAHVDLRTCRSGSRTS